MVEELKANLINMVNVSYIYIVHIQSELPVAFAALLARLCGGVTLFQHLFTDMYSPHMIQSNRQSVTPWDLKGPG